MIFLLLVLLTVLGGAAAVGIAVNGRKRLPGGSPQKQLTAGQVNGDTLIERGVRELLVGDVLTIDTHDFICEGLVKYDEDGHRWVGGRLVDDKDVRWLVVGLERTGSTALRLMTQDETTSISGYPSEAIVIGEVRYALDKRGAATCNLFGELGALGDLKKGRPEGHTERCRWWLYSAPGDDTLIVEQFGADYRVLRGKKVGESTIDLMPGS